MVNVYNYGWRIADFGFENWAGCWVGGGGGKRVIFPSDCQAENYFPQSNDHLTAGSSHCLLINKRGLVFCESNTA